MWRPRDQIQGVSKATQLELKAVLLESRAAAARSHRRREARERANRGVHERAQRDTALSSALGDSDRSAAGVTRALAAKAALYERLRRDEAAGDAGSEPLPMERQPELGGAPSASEAADRRHVEVAFVRAKAPRNDAERLQQTAETAQQRAALLEARQRRREQRQQRRTEVARLLAVRQQRVDAYRKRLEQGFIPLAP